MNQDWADIPKVHRQVLAIYAANAFCGVFLLGSRIVQFNTISRSIMIAKDV
jgi:hypothetical protein